MKSGEHAPSRAPALAEWAMQHPKRVFVACGVLTVLLAALFVRLDVDTDPENMLPADDPARVANVLIEERFGAGEVVVAGVIAPDRVATPARLDAVFALHESVAGIDGVVSAMSVASLGSPPPADEAAAAELVADVAADPLLAGNVLSADGTAAAVFISIEDKSVASDVADQVDGLIASDPELDGLETHVAGLPLAEDAFGSEMFVQMAIFAPLAGLLIFVLLLLFFRRLALVVPAMVLAMATVIWTMGLLIGTGNTVHIMSSMIPIFLMPIAILDSVHVLSEFFDRYAAIRDRRRTLRVVMSELYRPLSFTSLTTGVAFAGLALVPIPPVRVFGIFVAVGVFLAWLLTLTLLPAMIVRLDEARLEAAIRPRRSGAALDSLLAGLGRSVVRRRTVVLVAFGLIALLAVPAIASLTVNDNPVRWFRSGEDIRVATERLNTVLPGTFSANFLVEADTPDGLQDPATASAVDRLATRLEATDEVGSVVAYTDLASIDDPRAGSLIDGDLANVQLQLRSGDNVDMQAVVDVADAHLAVDPIPGASTSWAGETYLNLRWQDRMVTGMLYGFLTTLAVVLALLVALFRSLRWALLGILPVLWTVLVVYGLIGAVGRDFDMPIAVLSALVLGIGVDFAIHYVERFRALSKEHRTTEAALAGFFREPSRALTRNALVIAIGFTPLFLSSLVPYVVVGALLASLIVLSWLSTIIVLPAITSYRKDEPELGTRVDPEVLPTLSVGEGPGERVPADRL